MSPKAVGATRPQRAAKIRAELGYEPELSLEEGLADTVAWIERNRGWWEPLKHGTSS